ncbi:hypothetical protein ABI59_07475 [Acidobacteria bacterium Mor1]|nr:hypothetical protein ABI59_07475 [Acidobacteria bacterium Mor1]
MGSEPTTDQEAGFLMRFKNLIRWIAVVLPLGLSHAGALSVDVWHETAIAPQEVVVTAFDEQLTALAEFRDRMDETGAVSLVIEALPSDTQLITAHCPNTVGVMSSVAWPRRRDRSRLEIRLFDTCRLEDCDAMGEHGALWFERWRSQRDRALLRLAARASRTDKGMPKDWPLRVRDPRPRKQKRPTYPFTASVKEVEGNVTLRATVRRDGSVSDIEVLDCDTPGYGFEDAAVETVQRWTYKPARFLGEQVEMMLTVKVHFEVERSTAFP